MSAAVVTFRLLSGNNIGAVFTLPQGKYTLGTSDNCDIQLDESGETTVVGLSISPELAVSVVLLSGKARLDGVELEQGQALSFASAQVLAIGFSALTHLDEGEDPFTVDLGMLGWAQRPEQVAPSEALAEVAPASPAHVDQSTVATTSTAQEMEADAPEADAPEAHGSTLIAAQAPETKPQRHFSKLLLLIVGLILLGLALSSLIAGSALFGNRAKQREALQTATTYLDSHGFAQVKAHWDDRVITFKGYVASQEEFNRLVNNLPPLPYATVLALEIKDSLLLRVEQACAVRGASVSASYLPQRPHSHQSHGDGESSDSSSSDTSDPSNTSSPSHSQGKQAKIAVRGYVQDKIVEAALLRSVAADLQYDELVGAFTLKPQLEAIMARFLPLELYTVPLLADRFKVYYDGELTLAQMELLAALQERVSQEVQAPVLFEPLENRDRDAIEHIAQNTDKIKRVSLRAETPTTASATTEAPQDLLTEQTEAEPLDFDEISGVTMTPLRFVSMKDGSKYFEGAVMSNGAVLKSISVHALTFEVNGELEVHELK